jgi:putative ABC transport system ATP-binding protein
MTTLAQSTSSSMLADDECVVRCRGVKKTYGSGQSAVRALRGVDLDVRRGEMLMLVGPSGCGKTTLISVVAGVLDRDEGACTVLNADYSAMSGAEKARFRAVNIGFVFQQFNLIPTLTIAENVAVPLLINNIPRGEAITRAKDMLSKVGLGERVNDEPRKLSGGQQQRVAISRALVHNPKLIVCDEPTSALDHATGQKVMELLRSVAAHGDLSLLVVTHDQRIFEFADRIAEMDDGHIVRLISGKGHLVSTSHPSEGK